MLTKGQQHDHATVVGLAARLTSSPNIGLVNKSLVRIVALL